MKTFYLILACLVIGLTGTSLALGAGYDRQIHQAQSKLKALGYSPGTPDGVMGKNTQNAVKRFQKDKGLPVTGILNTQTLKQILNLSTGIGSQSGNALVNQALLTAQQLLSTLGYTPGPADGVMGKNTRKAIKQFQKDKGLPVTGKLNDTTFRQMKTLSKDQGHQKDRHGKGPQDHGKPQQDDARYPPAPQG